MKHLGAGQVLEMVSDDPASDPDIRSWTGKTGHQLLVVERDGPAFRFFIRKT